MINSVQFAGQYLILSYSFTFKLENRLHGMFFSETDTPDNKAKGYLKLSLTKPFKLKS